jgi:hypothetical protein
MFFIEHLRGRGAPDMMFFRFCRNALGVGAGDFGASLKGASGVARDLPDIGLSKTASFLAAPLPAFSSPPLHGAALLSSMLPTSHGTVCNR